VAGVAVVDLTLIDFFRTVSTARFNVVIHQNTWSNSPNGAAAFAIDANQTVNINTLACNTNIFQYPVLYITIEGTAPARYDFAFAIKKGALRPHGVTVFVIPPQVPLFKLMTLQHSLLVCLLPTKPGICDPRDTGSGGGHPRD
jgi:hypothetical protein